MKFKILVFLICILLSIMGNAKPIKKLRRDNLKEGFLLYQLEAASWNATETLFKDFSELAPSITGYLSYSENNNVKTIFWNSHALDSIVLTITFDSSFSLKNIVIEKSLRIPTRHEKNLMELKSKAINEMEYDSVLFRAYAKTTLNVVPVKEGKISKVYIMTAPQSKNEILFGNDYLLTFNKKQRLKSKIKLHKNLIRVPAIAKDAKGNNLLEAETFHIHRENTEDILTATDICTILLYKNFTNWKSHYVISDKYISLWNIKNGNFDIISRKAWDKITSSEAE